MLQPAGTATAETSVKDTTTQTFVSIAQLGKGENAPVTATKANTLNLIEG